MRFHTRVAILHAATFVAVIALASACGGTASVGVEASSTNALALSADDAAAGQPAAPAGTTADALLLHVVSTDAHVAATGDPDGGNGPDDGAGAGHGASDGSDGDSDAAGGGFTTISSAARDVDLKALASSPDDIADGTIPAGRLTEI